MSRSSVPFACLSLSLSTIAFTQGVFNPSNVPTTTMPVRAERDAVAGFNTLRMQRMAEERCQANGCVILVNRSPKTIITQARLDNGSQGWSGNMLQRYVPRDAPYLMFGSSAQRLCDRTVQLMARGPGGTTIVREAKANFCSANPARIVLTPTLEVIVAS